MNVQKVLYGFASSAPLRDANDLVLQDYPINITLHILVS